MSVAPCQSCGYPERGQTDLCRLCRERERYRRRREDARQKILNAPKCRHCHTRRAGRPRGLCCACYDRVDIRERYECRAKRAPERIMVRPLPLAPTRTRPGTEQRVRVYEQRAERSEQLFHPLDATLFEREAG